MEGLCRSHFVPLIKRKTVEREFDKRASITAILILVNFDSKTNKKRENLTG